MSNMDKPEENSQAVPFFARYLEGQWCEELSEEEMDDVRGGRGFAMTRKYPSDWEDSVGCFTRKYPSDQEEGGGGPVMTKKYPSDHEEGGGGPMVTEKFPSDQEDGGGGQIVTLKFPSDFEDAHQK